MVGEMDGRLWLAMQSLRVEDTLSAEDREEACRIAQAKAGDDAAIGWLLARYRRRVVRLATHILRRSSEAEDVAQEAFVRAFRNLSAFRGDGRFYAWLYQIVFRICLDRQRLARWHAETPYEAIISEAPDQATGTMDGVESRLLVEALLDRLNPPMRAMLVLRELEGLEYEEIARVLQIPVGRVRWRLHVARAKFQQLWESAMQEVDHV